MIDFYISNILNDNASKSFPGATLEVRSQSFMFNGYYDKEAELLFCLLSILL